MKKDEPNMTSSMMDEGDNGNKFSDFFVYQGSIGRGAFGTVVKAVRKSDKQTIAVKVKRN
jgi:hypothetical protein